MPRCYQKIDSRFDPTGDNDLGFQKQVRLSGLYRNNHAFLKDQMLKEQKQGVMCCHTVVSMVNRNSLG